MSVNDESAASREFVASSVAYSPIWEKVTGQRATKYWLAGFAVIVSVTLLMTAGPTYGLHLRLPRTSPAVGYGLLAGIVVASMGIGAYWFWHSRRKYLITVTSAGLTIDRRRGDVYSLADAQLGLWVNMGVALHLRCGRHRFLLGGRDRRVGPATPLNATPVQLVDAWLSQSEFDELLFSMGDPWGPAARGPAPGGPTRCLLFPNPLLIQRMGWFAFRKKQRLMGSLSQPQLFIDVDNDAIRVIDPNGNVVNASASLSQVTATPATYHLAAGHLVPSAQNVASDSAGQYFSTMPAIAVSVPGMQPLTVGCRDFTGFKRRFSWDGNVPVTNDPPAYTVSAADWLTLVERLGLPPYLEDKAKSG